MVFSALAWLKWQYLCHAGSTEVVGFGLSSIHNPLYLDDVLVIRQQATPVTVGFDDHAVADLFDEMADAGIPPSRFARTWLHTHPGSSVTPSGTDEDTFQRCFGGCDWSVMAILGQTGRTYARLRFNAGPGTSVVIPTGVDWSGWPDVVSDPAFDLRVRQWEVEYHTLVEAVEFRWGGESFGEISQSCPSGLPTTSGSVPSALDATLPSACSKTSSLLIAITSAFAKPPVVPRADTSHEIGLPEFTSFGLLNPDFPGGFHACE